MSPVNILHNYGTDIKAAVKSTARYVVKRPRLGVSAVSQDYTEVMHFGKSTFRRRGCPRCIEGEVCAAAACYVLIARPEVLVVAHNTFTTCPL